MCRAHSSGGSNLGAAVADFLRESKIGEASIEWLDPRFSAVTTAAGHQRTPVRT